MPKSIIPDPYIESDFSFGSLRAASPSQFPLPIQPCAAVDFAEDGALFEDEIEGCEGTPLVCRLIQQSFIEADIGFGVETKESAGECGDRLEPPD